MVSMADSAAVTSAAATGPRWRRLVVGCCLVAGVAGCASEPPRTPTPIPIATPTVPSLPPPSFGIPTTPEGLWFDRICSAVGPTPPPTGIGPLFEPGDLEQTKRVTLELVDVFRSDIATVAARLALAGPAPLAEAEAAIVPIRERIDAAVREVDRLRARIAASRSLARVDADYALVETVVRDVRAAVRSELRANPVLRRLATESGSFICLI